MARMADRLLARGIVGERDEGFASILRSCERIIVDEVLDYFYAGTDQENWNWREDFPNLAPPFPVFWMEAIAPKLIRTTLHPGEVRPLPADCRFASLGVLVEGHRRPSEGSSKDFVTRAALSFPHVADRTRPADFSQLLLSEVEWIVGFSLYLEDNNRRIHFVLMNCLFLDKMGVLIDARNPDGKSQSIWTPLAGPRLSGLPRAAIPDISVTLLPFALAISLMHCKNVELVTKPQNPKLARAYRRRHKEPMLTYHILEIEPMKKLLRGEGESQRTGLRQALHICRGHFKDYRERGLFGKHKGVFWWESRLRGSTDEGTIIKDYKLRRERRDMAHE